MQNKRTKMTTDTTPKKMNSGCKKKPLEAHYHVSPTTFLPDRRCLPLSGFYLISPSEFERFSLSTRYLVEPRCLVDAPLHSASGQHRRQPDGASSPHWFVVDILIDPTRHSVPFSSR